MIVNDVISVMRHDTLKFSPAIVMNVDTQYRIYQAFNVFSTQKVSTVRKVLVVVDFVQRASLVFLHLNTDFPTFSTL